MNKLYDAITEIHDEYILDAENASKKHHRFRWKPLVAAVLVVVLLAIPVSAEVVNGYVSNLLAPLFGGAQTEILDKIGKPIGATVTADGYTLTADAVVGDQYNVAIVYTLSRDDGEPVPEGTHFAEWDTDIIWGASGGGSLTQVKNEEDPSKLHFIESWSRESPLIGRYVSAYFSNLEIYNENGEDIPIADGPWELKYTLRYEDTSVNVPVNALKVIDMSGENCQINKISISNVGLRLDGVIFDPQWREAPPFRDFEVSVRTKDGTVTLLEDANGGGGYATGDKTAKFHFNAMFEIPLDLDEIDALIICGTEHIVSIAE